MRELRPGLHGERDEPKLELLLVLHGQAPTAVADAILELATGDIQGSDSTLGGLFELLKKAPAVNLEGALLEAISARRVPEDRLGIVGDYLLRGNDEFSLHTFSSLISSERSEKADNFAVHAAAALFIHRTSHSWPAVQRFMTDRPDLASRVLERIFYGERFWGRSANVDGGLSSLTAMQIADLTCVLLRVYPPEQDPDYDDAHWVSPPDRARHARSQLISWLTEQRTAEAVAALAFIEDQFGKKYQWIRNARATAERGFRSSQWRPLEATTIGELLEATGKRLVRSDTDALDAIVEAISAYGNRLRHDQIGDLEDYWNLPRSGPITPKAEERASEKICAAIRNYFRDYAVTADREVQIVRRLTSTKKGGAPGSRPDVLCRFPAGTTLSDTPIAIPLEVKLSFNPEARTGLVDQLSSRYIPEVFGRGGVFVVVWMTAPGLNRGHRPQWANLREARQELAELVLRTRASHEGQNIRAVIIDASLPADVRCQRRSNI